MAYRKIKMYGRCQKCKELVRYSRDCDNCKHRNPLSANKWREVVDGRREPDYGDDE